MVSRSGRNLGELQVELGVWGEAPGSREGLLRGCSA